MANENGNGAGAANQQGPSLNTLIQYIKDFSFENPNAPRSLIQQQQPQGGPQIGLQVNVHANALGESDFETILTLEGKATLNDETLFAFELSYAGVFRIQGVPQEQLHAVVMIDCPRLLFPFARAVVADAVRNGGFRRSTSTRSISPSSIASVWKKCRRSRACRTADGSGREGQRVREKRALRGSFHC